MTSNTTSHSLQTGAGLSACACWRNGRRAGPSVTCAGAFSAKGHPTHATPVHFTEGCISSQGTGCLWGLRHSPPHRTARSPAMQITPVIAIHMAAALAAIAIGLRPLGRQAPLSAPYSPCGRLRLGDPDGRRPCRPSSYLPAISPGQPGAHSPADPGDAGDAGHGAFIYLARRSVVGHREMMQRPPSGACVVAEGVHVAARAFSGPHGLGPHSD